MKRILFISAMVLGAITCSFSQIKLELKPENNAKKKWGSESYNRYELFKDGYNPENIKLSGIKSITGGEEGEPDLGSLKIKSDKDLAIRYSPRDNMPYLKSKSNDPMPIYKADSTMEYTIRIKEVE